jgi:hypothetical protein
MMIRELFSANRPIDRRIEKVIDYYADDEERLSAEIEEYEATPSVERNFRKFLDVYQDGVQGGQVTEVGIWVSGFYGSGKSSFTKNLGFALDPDRIVHGQSFLDLLSARIQDSAVQSQLRTVAKNAPTAVVLLDLGADQLALLESVAECGFLQREKARTVRIHPDPARAVRRVQNSLSIQAWRRLGKDP